MIYSFSILIITLLFFSCKKEENPVEGCMDPLALNYNSEASIDNGNCNYAPITDINIHFTQTVGGDTLILDNMMYVNQAGQSYSVQTVRYLISDITLYKNDGGSTLLDEVHFIDISIPSTLTLSIPEIEYGSYTSIGFTMGLNNSKNITNLFLNENFFPSFTWPEFLGGGYHYMQLEGDFNTVFNGYATHTGATDGIDFSFNKLFPININATNSIRDIDINMDIANWYQNPEAFNFTTDGIMGDTNSQIILQANGIEDVFSVQLQTSILF